MDENNKRHWVSEEKENENWQQQKYTQFKLMCDLDMLNDFDAVDGLTPGGLKVDVRLDH